MLRGGTAISSLFSLILPSPGSSLSLWVRKQSPGLSGTCLGPRAVFRDSRSISELAPASVSRILGTCHCGSIFLQLHLKVKFYVGSRTGWQQGLKLSPESVAAAVLHMVEAKDSAGDPQISPSVLRSQRLSWVWDGVLADSSPFLSYSLGLGVWGAGGAVWGSTLLHSPFEGGNGQKPAWPFGAQ